jgi:cyclohexanone monooxygenase
MDLMNATIIIKQGEHVRSWFLGANVEGKAHGVYFYFGGAAGYFDELAAVVDGGFQGFTLGRAAVSV